MYICTMSKWNYRRDYFQKIDSSKKAYFLGLFMADGNMHTKTNGGTQVQITAKQEDMETLVEFRKELEYEKPVTLRTRKRKETITYAAEINIFSKEIFDDLLNLGVTPKKSFLGTFVDMEKVPQEFHDNFWMGYFDGDGSIDKNSGVINVCFNGEAHLNFLKYLDGKLQKSVNIYRTENKDGSYLNRIILKKMDSMRIMNKLYNSNSFYLKRKHAIFVYYKSKMEL